MHRRMIHRLAGVTSVLLAMGAVAQPPEMPPAPVMTAFVEAGGVAQPVRLTGTAEPLFDAILAAEEDGVMDRLMVDEGDSVTTGTILAQLRLEPYQFQRDASVASANAEDARLAELKAGTRVQELKIARADYAEASVNLEVAERDLARFADLFKSRSVSESELDGARNSYEAAKAGYDSAKLRLELAEEGPRAEEILSQEARAASARAAANLATDTFERAVIRAPFAGVITRRHVSTGSWISKGDPVLTLESVQEVRIRVSVPEQEYNKVTIGREANVTFEAYPEATFPAKVSRIIPRADAGSRAFPILINLKNPDLKFAPGMLARVTFDRQIPASTVMMPKDAIVPQGPVPVVFRVEIKDGKAFAERLEVKTGRFFGQSVEVISDNLKPGDRVVTRGNERLQPGQEIAVNSFVTYPAAYVADPSKFFNE